MTPIADNIAAIQKRIGDAQNAPHAVQLIAVSKQQPDDRIDETLQAGQRLFGENRVQEAQQRWQQRKALMRDIRLHMIGHLQSNKARDAVALFDVIETIDGADLADAVRAAMIKQNRAVQCLVQINTGVEAQKDGVSPENFPALLAHCQAIGLTIDGLMAIPPADAPAALHFALLKKIAAQHGLAALSMGMSADFEKAVALGATSVRIGTGIFSQRS